MEGVSLAVGGWVGAWVGGWVRGWVVDAQRQLALEAVGGGGRSWGADPCRRRPGIPGR